MVTNEATLHKNPLAWLFACPLVDEEQIHRWRLLNSLLLVWLVILALADAARFLVGAVDEGNTTEIAVLILAVLYWVNRRGWVDLASQALVWLGTLLITAIWMIRATDMLNVIAIPGLYVLPILLACTLLGGRSVVAITAAISGLTLWLYLWVLPQTAVFHIVPASGRTQMLLFTFTLFGAAGALGWRANREVRMAAAALREQNVRLAAEMTERKRAEGALRMSEQRYRSLFEHNQAGVLRTRLNGEILNCNPALLQMLGYDTSTDMVGQLATNFIADRSELVYLQARLRAESFASGLEVSLRGRNGEVVNTLASISQMNDENGEGVLEATLIDITRLKQKEAALEMLSTHDPLTGLYNRRALNDILAQNVKACIYEGERRSGIVREMALILIDIDHFKLVNDRYGHQEGDAVLQEVTRRISLTARAQDYVARYGGEEVAVLLPGADEEEAWIIAERIRAAVAESPITITARPLVGSTGAIRGVEGVQITISLGIACGPIDISDDERKDVARAQEALISIADQGLYEAKRQGRNCVVAVGRNAILHSA